MTAVTAKTSRAGQPSGPIEEIARAAAIDPKGKKTLDCSGAADAAARGWGGEAVDPTTDAGWSKFTAIPDNAYDVVVSSGALHLMPPDRVDPLLAKLHDVLKPGGVAIVHTTPVFDADAADLASSLRAPIPHLLFDRTTIENYVAAKGLPKPRRLLPYCASSWLMLYRVAGFDIAKVVRHPSTIEPELFTRFADRLSWFDEEELHTGALTVVLQRPMKAPDLTDIVLVEAEA